jgi:hypothetical protein
MALGSERCNMSKPTAYLAKERTGYFMMEYTYRWVARDYWGNRVASGRTKRECQQETRKAGYTPVDD